MSDYDHGRRDMPAAGTEIGGGVRGLEVTENGSDNGDETAAKCAETAVSFEYKTWLQVLPSNCGLLLASLLAEIMTEGLTPEQIDILGNFISAVGSLISYKASRED